MQETQEMRVQSLGWEDPLEEENYNPLQCSCLKNPTYRGAWRAIVQRVAKSRTRLSDSAHTHRLDNIICSLDVLFSSVQFSLSVVSDSLRPHESQHARPPCPSPTPGVYSNSCPSSRWCHPAISSSVIPFSCCPQSLPASGSFPMSQLFKWDGQSAGVSASTSVLPMNTQDWPALG